MLKFENRIRIERPAGEVFAFLADLENIPRWNYYVLEVKKLSPGPAGAGATYHQVRKTDEQDLRISEFEPGGKLTVETISAGYPQLEMSFTLIPEGTATELVDHWQLDTGRPALLEKLAGGKVRAAVAENLGVLKQLLETGRAVLQDGREVRLG